MDKVGEDNIPSSVYSAIASNDFCIAIVYQAGEGRVYIIDILALTLSPLLSVHPPPPHSLLQICCENVNTWRLKYPEQIGAYTFSSSSNVCWDMHQQVLFLMSLILTFLSTFYTNMPPTILCALFITFKLFFSNNLLWKPTSLKVSEFSRQCLWESRVHRANRENYYRVKWGLYL